MEKVNRTKLEIMLHPTDLEIKRNADFLNQIYTQQELEVLKSSTFNPKICSVLASFEENGADYFIFQNDDKILLFGNVDIKVGDWSFTRYGIAPLSQEIKEKINNGKLIYKLLYNFTNQSNTL